MPKPMQMLGFVPPANLRAIALKFGMVRSRDGSLAGDGDCGKERTLQKLLYNNAEIYADVGFRASTQPTASDRTTRWRSHFYLQLIRKAYGCWGSFVNPTYGERSH